MDPVLKRAWRLGNNRGQTSVEYLLLLAAAFLTGYVVISGPISNFTRLMLLDIRSVVANVVANGELKRGQVVEQGQPGHPADKRRFKAMH